MEGLILSFLALNLVLTILCLTTKYASNRDQEILDLQRELAFWKQLFEATKTHTNKANLERDAEMPSNEEFLSQIYKSMSKNTDTHSGHENTVSGHSSGQRTEHKSNQTEYVKLCSDTSTETTPRYEHLQMNITTEQIRLANCSLDTHRCTPKLSPTLTLGIKN